MGKSTIRNPQSAIQGPARIAALVRLWSALLSGGASQAQMVFPDLIPQNAALVVSIPDAGRAWKALHSSEAYSAIQALRIPLFQLGEQGDAKQRENAPDASLRNRLLFGGTLSASEMAIVPGRSGGRSPAFLFLGKVQDLSALRKLLDTLELRLTNDVSSPRNPVTRQIESINQTALVLLSDAGSSIGYFVNGPRGICGISNDASLLRQTARRLEKSPSPPAGGQDPKNGGPSRKNGVPRPFPEIERAWKELLRAPGNHEYHVRFLMAPPGSAASPETGQESAPRKDGETDSLLQNLRPRGGLVAGLSFLPDSIRMETFALFPTNVETLMENLYRAASLSRDLPGAAFAAPDALMLSGNQLLAVPVLKRSMIEVLDQWSARIPQASPSGLNPASARAQAQLALLRNWMNDPAFLAELGPSWFFVLNDFAFQKPGEFPRIDLVLGFETRQVETTRQRMLALETDILRAVEAWLGKTLDAPAFLEETFSLSSGPVRIRSLQIPHLPPAFRPGWTIYAGHLLIALSPESLQSALRRQAEAQSVTDKTAESTGKPSAPPTGEPADPPTGRPADWTTGGLLRAESGMESIHAYQVIHLGRAARILQAVLQTIAAKRDPSLQSQIASLAGALERVDSIVIFRRGIERGVHTVGEIRIGSLPAGDKTLRDGKPDHEKTGQAR